MVEQVTAECQHRALRLFEGSLVEEHLSWVPLQAVFECEVVDATVSEQLSAILEVTRF